MNSLYGNKSLYTDCNNQYLLLGYWIKIDYRQFKRRRCDSIEFVEFTLIIIIYCILYNYWY